MIVASYIVVGMSGNITVFLRYGCLWD